MTEDRWISRTAVREQLGMHDQAVARAVKLGALTERIDADRPRIRLGGGVDGPQVMEEFYAKIGPCLTEEDFELPREVGRLLLGKRRALPPQGLTDDAFNLMEKEEGEPTVARLQTLTGTTEAIARRQILDRIVVNGGDAADINRHYRAEPGDHETEVLARLPEDLKEPPGTYLCKKTGCPDDRPEEGEFARLRTIKNERLFIAATLVTLRLAATNMAKDLREKLMRAIMKVDRAGAGRDLDDPFVVRHVLETILGVQWSVTNRAEGAAAEFVNGYNKICEHFDRYLAQAVPRANRGTYRARQLVPPAGAIKFFGMVRTNIRKSQAAATLSRQVRIEKILDEPLEFLLVGRLRLKEHQALRDRFRAEIDLHIKSGKELTEPLRFQVPYVTRLINDRFRRCEQTLHAELWTWDLAHEAMHAENASLRRLKRSYGENAAVDNAGRAAYVIAFMGVTPKEPGGPTQTPLMAEVAGNFILDELTSLDDEQRARRMAACEVWDWDATRLPAVPGGLPHFPWSRRHTAREANKLLTRAGPDGKPRRVLFMAHEEFTHGLMFAHASVFISADAGCRTGETLQAPSKRSLYETDQDPDTLEVFKKYKAIGKGGVAMQPMLSPDTFKHVTDLVIEIAVRWHGGKLPPAVEGNHHLKKQKKVKGPDFFAFTIDDRMINASELATLHRVLYLGWHGLQGHDVRHIFNAMGRRAGISREVRQRLLYHADPLTTDAYGPATPGEVSRQQRNLQRHVSERASTYLESLAPGSSEEMREADRELRLAETIHRFYESEGIAEKAEEARTKARHWAEQLARATAEHTRGAEVVDVAAI